MKERFVKDEARKVYGESCWRNKRLETLLVAVVLVNLGCLLLSHHWESNSSFWWLFKVVSDSTGPPPPTSLAQFQQCSIDNFLSTGLPFMKGIEAPGVDEYIERRQRLAVALDEDGIDAFIVEPGYTFQYYANVSQEDWEPWEPEERPFLMVVRPEKDDRGVVSANTTFLSPAFEAERVHLLGMPFAEPLSIVGWEEHWNPYTTLLQSTLFADVQPSSAPKVMVDEEMRDYIQRGLSLNGFDVVGLSGNLEAVRQTKSSVEAAILRAVNTGTVEAIRQMRKCLYPGLTEGDVKQVLDKTLEAAGLDPFFDIVLFDENASNPHGGTNGTKILTSETFVLIDVGAHLHGYSSDVCRTFVPPFLPKTAAIQRKLQKKMDVWDVVFRAQTASIGQFQEGNSAASVDVAARKIITDAGYGAAFTHRLGHGIGIKAHESPYLNKGNHNVTLRPGMAFTSEPGVYLVDEFGVRHEDIFLVAADGEQPECLSGDRAIGPWDP